MQKIGGVYRLKNWCVRNYTPFFCTFVSVILNIMSIGSTPMDVHLKIAVTLNDAIAWFDAHTPEVEKLIVHLITFDQLKINGVDKFNEVIGLYSEITQQINPIKIAGTPYTLEDTGTFYRSMYIVVLKNSILIEANTGHMQDQKWWSINILGLNEQNLGIYKAKIRENYISYTRWTLGIN
jgi:hypothetical protein